MTLSCRVFGGFNCQASRLSYGMTDYVSTS